jgi:alanyl-tRNA synthetase
VGLTERLYYTDSYLREFRANVTEAAEGGCRVYLDRTAFYPASGGQPHDTGTLGGTEVIEVADDDGRIAHVTAAPVAPSEVACRIDWPRRFDHMQQHSGQHLLSAVLVEMYSAQTVGFHLGAASSAIDVAVRSLTDGQLAAAEARANEVVFENRPVAISFEDSETAGGLRKASERQGTLRIVSIEGLDRSACGGTHVRATGEIGPILIRKLDRAHGNLRIEFLCGMRAVRRARADYDALSRIARTFSSAIDDAPAQAAAQAESLEAADKARRKAAIELAGLHGREMYRSTPPGPNGLRSVVERIPAGTPDEEVRTKAQGFTAESRSCYVSAAGGERPSILLAVSQDAAIHAGDTLKTALAKLGGRGGGNRQIAQGSAPSPEALEELLRILQDAIEAQP